MLLVQLQGKCQMMQVVSIIDTMLQEMASTKSKRHNDRSSTAVLHHGCYKHIMSALIGFSTTKKFWHL
jgi:hypothetical protein